jgi:hypothetical protein
VNAVPKRKDKELKKEKKTPVKMKNVTNASKIPTPAQCDATRKRERKTQLKIPSASPSLFRYMKEG